MPRPLVDHSKNAEVSTTVATINKDELVNEKSMPFTSSGSSLFI